MGSCIPEKVLDRIVVDGAAAVPVVADDTSGDEDLAGIVPAEEVDAVPGETGVWDVYIRDHGPM